MKSISGLPAILICAMAAFAGPYASWSNYRNVTVNTTGTTVANTVTNFPLLVRLTNASAATGGDVLAASATGADVRFSDSTGNTALPYQIENWSATDAEIWVLVPGIAAATSTNIRMYWGSAGATSASSGPAVFDSATGFKAVWHLNDSGSTVVDATGSGYNGTSATPPTAATGAPLPGGRTFDGATQFLYMPTPTSGPYSGVTSAAYFEFGVHAAYSATAWLQNTYSTASPIGGIISHGNQDWQLQIQNATNCGTGSAAGCYAFSEWSTTAAYQNAYEPTPIHDGTWHYVAGVRNTASPYLVLYVDGVQISTFTTNDGAAKTGNGTTTTFPMTLGAYPNSAALPPATEDYYLGSMVEATVENTNRSSDWIQLCYQTQKPGGTAVTLGATQTTASVPGAPTAVSGIPGNGQVTVSWTAPASNGGAAITSYTATSVQDTSKHCATSGLTCIVSGLTNGTAYTFTVTATNAAGIGPASAPSTPVTPTAPNGTPGAPTGVTGYPGNGQVVVTWAAPASTGSSAITGYVAASSPGGYVCPSTTTFTCTVTGLTNGTAYTFTVTATNASGAGPASAPSAPVTPVSVPSAPRGVTGTPASATQIVVSWVAPATSGGDSITKYTVTSAPGGDTCTTAGALTCTVSGLTGGTTYTFTVTATNAVGTSAPSAASSPVTGILSAASQQGMDVRTVGSMVLFSLPAAMPQAGVQISVMDIWGRTVWSKTVNSGEMNGAGEISWNGVGRNGLRSAAGLYIVQMNILGGTQVSRVMEKKIILNP